MAVVATRSSGETSLGPGLLYVAPIATTDPTTSADAVAATLPSAWREVGYTEDGSMFKHDTKFEDTEVAEELDPIGTSLTARSGSLEFKMKQASRRNMALAVNLGAAAVNDNSILEPPDPSAMLRVKIIHVSADADAVRAVLFRQCFNVSGLEIDWSKAPKAALIPVMFRLEKPTGKTAWAVLPNASGIAV